MKRSHSRCRWDVLTYTTEPLTFVCCCGNTDIKVGIAHPTLITLAAFIMNPKFTQLNCDDDVVLLATDTFKVSRLKELCLQEIQHKFYRYIYNSQTKQPDRDVAAFFNHISFGGESISFSEIQFNSIKDCQLLKIGGKGWQKGKLKIQICRAYTNATRHKVCLEFCPDEPIEQESPLDDICKLVEK